MLNLVPKSTLHQRSNIEHPVLQLSKPATEPRTAWVQAEFLSALWQVMSLYEQLPPELRNGGEVAPGLSADWFGAVYADWRTFRHNRPAVF